MIVNHISTNSSAITLTTLHLRETISSASSLLFLLNYQSLMMTHYHFNESNRVTDSSRGLLQKIREILMKYSQKICKIFAKNSWKIREKFAKNSRKINICEIFRIFSQIFCKYFANFNFSRIFCELFANILRIFHKFFANFSRIFRKYFAKFSRIFCARPREESVMLS